MILHEHALAVEPSTAAALPQPPLFVLPTRNGGGFQASIRGHLLELADPDSPAGLAPTPDDLMLVSVASDLAWSARRFLGARGLEAHVSVSADLRDDVTVTVAASGATIEETLIVELETVLATRSPGARVRVG